MKIKYDCNYLRIVYTLAVGSVIAVIAGIMLVVMEVSGTEEISFWCIFLAGGIFIVSLAGIISAKMYFGRLAAYGYEIPDNKRTYSNQLENLPRASMIIEQTSLFGKYSRYGMFACLCLYAVFMAINSILFIKWKFMGEDNITVFIMFSVFLLIWLILVIVLKRQSNKDKYRDDVETDTSRKVRWSTELIIFNIVIMFLLSCFALLTQDSMMNYMFKARIEYDREMAYRIGDVIKESVDEYIDNPSEDCEDTYKALCEGIEITSWINDYDELQNSILDKLKINDFSQLKDDFKLSEGPARIEVRLEDTKVYVKLVNPYRELEKYDKHHKEISIVSGE